MVVLCFYSSHGLTDTVEITLLLRFDRSVLMWKWYILLFTCSSVLCRLFSLRASSLFCWCEIVWRCISLVSQTKEHLFCGGALEWKTPRECDETCFIQGRQSKVNRQDSEFMQLIYVPAVHASCTLHYMYVVKSVCLCAAVWRAEGMRSLSQWCVIVCEIPAAFCRLRLSPASQSYNSSFPLGPFACDS